MELFIYTFKDQENNEKLCGYFRDEKPYPMVCDDRQRGRLDNYATEMAKQHNMEIKCHKVVTDDSTVVVTFGSENNKTRETEAQAEVRSQEE